MAESLTGQYEMPPINILDMILGGGPKPYFSRRGAMSDQIWLANQERQMRGQFAKGLLGTPEFAGAMANPYDRRANYGLWAVTQGGPESIANQGANWLQTSIQSIYGREATSFEDALAKSRITLSTDEALRLEKGKLDLAQQAQQQMLQSLFGTDPNTGQTGMQSELEKHARWQIAAKAGLVQEAQPGMIADVGPNGQLVWRPMMGTPQWQEAMGKLTPLQAINGATDELIAMSDGKMTWDTGRAKQLTQSIQDLIRKSLEMGSLDQGTADAMENYLTGVTTTGTYMPGSKQNLYMREQLRGLKHDTARKIMDWERSYMTPIENAGDPYARTFGPTKPAPTTSPQIGGAKAEETKPAQPRRNRAGGLIIEQPEAAPNVPSTQRRNRAGGLIY